MLPKSKYLAKRNFIYAIIEEKYSNKASNHSGWQDRLTFTRNQKKKKSYIVQEIKPYSIP